MLWATSSETKQQETLGPACIYTDHNTAVYTTNYKPSQDLTHLQTPGNYGLLCLNAPLRPSHRSQNHYAPNIDLHKLTNRSSAPCWQGDRRQHESAATHPATTCSSEHQLCCCGEGEQRWVPRKACHRGSPLDRQHLVVGQDSSQASELSL